MSSEAGNLPAPMSPLLAFADGLLASTHHEKAQDPGELRQYVSFVLRDDEFAIPILDCREILRAPAITRIPEAPAEVRGVVNLRGRLVPAVDVRTCLGLEQAPLTGRSRLIVVESAGRFFALVVDRVARILRLASSQIVAPSGAPRFACLVGVATVAQSAIHILDSERLLLASPGMKPTTEME
jgi:chemotaxis signal transduction protein